MGNLTFYSQAIDDAALVVTSAATGHPKENMQDRRKATSWKSTSSANQNIDMDFGAPFAANYCFLYHNLPDNATIRLWGATQANYSDEAAIGAAQLVSARPNLEWGLGVTANYRYYRFKITTLPSVAEIFLVFMGAVDEMTIRHDFGQVQEKKYGGHVLKESFAGNRFSKRYYGGRKIFQFKWELLDLANQSVLQAVIENSKGSALPFFIKTVDDIYEYVRLMNAGIGAAEATHQLFNTDVLSFEEEF